MNSELIIKKRNRLENNEEKNFNKKIKNYSENDDMSILIKKLHTKKVQNKDKDSCFRNNYKKFQYDYEEDFYEPRF